MTGKRNRPSCCNMATQRKNIYAAIIAEKWRKING
nr:MAG TPA: hypothetical protein [Caudoviricetes sp.]